MSDDKRDVLEVLKFELAFLEQGGYGRSVRTPQTPTSIFLDSPSCLNFNDSGPRHPCNECLLTEFVPPEGRSEAVPCHHIPIGRRGETVADLEGNQMQTEEALRNWLREAIERLEKRRDAQAKSA